MENASTSTENEQNDATTIDDQMEYDAGCPFILEVKHDDGTQKEYKLMTIDENDQHKPCFSLPHGLKLSARVLLEFYLSDSFLYDVVKHTNEYGHYRAPQTFKNVTIGEIYIFFSIILYMGVVQLQVTNLMRPICILHNYMLDDVIPHQTMSELCLFMNLTYHALISHA